MPDTTPRPLTAATDRWRAELVSAAGHDALVDYRDLETGTLDLATAHPSGLAQFLAGRPTRLSSLFREPGALSTARRRARAIRQAAIQLADQHGVEGSYLASGMVGWQPRSGARVTAPVLLRPLTLRPRGVGHVDDDLDLAPHIKVNPALVRLLGEQGVHVDPAGLAQLAGGEHGFNPRPALLALREMAGHLEGFEVTERTVVGIFVDVVPAMLADYDALADVLEDHPVVGALAQRVTRPEGHTEGSARGGAPDGAESAPAGTEGAAAGAEGTAGAGLVPQADVPPSDVPATGGRPPRTVPFGVVELDPDQRRVVAAVEAGRSVVVTAPPGSGATRLLTQLVVTQAGRGRRTLLVSSQRAEAVGVADALADLGLAELVSDPSGLLASTRSRRHQAPEQSDPAATTAADGRTALAELRALAAERAALHEVTRPWGVTVSEAMHALARLSSGPGAPRTTVRLNRESAARLAGEQRQEVATLLREVADLGAFEARAQESPWYGAALASEQDAVAALEAARRLANEAMPELRSEMTRMASAAGLARAASVADWGRQIDLLVAVRATLDTFTPDVYERSVADLVAATATSQWREASGVRMSVLERRRWRRQAKDLLRPGSAPDDLHQALVRAQAERVQWQQMATGGGWPRVPTGLAETDAVYQRARQDLALLDTVLATTADGGGLVDTPVEDLSSRLERLAADDDLTRNLPARVATTRRLRELGLQDLLADLLARRVPAARVTDELELCWWASVLEHALGDQQVTAAGGLDAAAYRDEQQAAFAAATSRVRDTERARAEPSCTVVSPLSLPQHVPGRHRFDLVVIAGAHTCAVAEGVLAIARGAQVVVIGNPDGLPPAGLDLAPDDPAPGATPAPQPRRTSVLEVCADVLDRLELTYQHRMPTQLARTLARPPGWSVPAPDGGLDLALVEEGTGSLDVEGAVESVDAEVQRVVDLVLQHARTRPKQSLAVLTVTRHHARRVADAVRAGLAENPDVAPWFARPTTEPFVVTDLPRAEDSVRDAVLLTIGFGQTPRGRVLHRFGPLDADGGDRAVAVGATRARSSTTVVCCFGADDLDPGKLRTPGAKALRALLETASQPATPRRGLGSGTLDALLDDLAKRLRDKGFQVEPGDGRPGWPDLAVRVGGGEPVAVLTDSRWSPDAGEQEALDLVEDDLAVVDHLRRFGWRVVCLSSLDLFTDADAAVAAVQAAARGED